MKQFNFQKHVERIKENKAKIESGSYNCIPFTEKFPRLSTYLPGIIKGTYYIVTANSGVGKTQLTKYMFVRTPYDFIKNHPETGLKLKIIYFALEESLEEFINTIIVAWLAETYNIHIDVLALQSMLESLPQDIIDKIEEGKRYFEDLFECVDVVDSVSNPYGMYKYLREYSNNNGHHYWTQLNLQEGEEKLLITHDKYESFDKGKKSNWKYSHYEPHNPNEYVVAISDHISLLTPETDFNTGQKMNLHGTMGKWSADYCRKQITKHWKYVVVNVQQQAAAAENVDHFKANKLEPSLANLADNKLTARDALVIIGLFAPDRYELNKYMGYDIITLKDNFRSLLILKNRIGKPNLKLPLFYDGAVNLFKEMPKLDEEEKLRKVYEFVDKKQKR